MLKKIGNWVDERTGLTSMTREELHKPLPSGVGWPFSLGSAVLFLLIVMFVTGFALATVYAPTPDHAYASVLYIEKELPFGGIVRGLHHWSAGAVVVVAVLHLLRTLIYGAYKRPREATWILGVLLFFTIMGFAFTGYLLPWDQKAYWATVVGTKMAGSVPVIGDSVMKVLRGGPEIGALTLTRFYALHVTLLPWILIILAGFHLYLVRKHGTAGPWAAYQGPNRSPNPFYPNQIFKDMVVAAGILAVVLFLAIRYGAPLEPVANPASSDYVPKPEWYFLSLYQLLKYLPGPLEVVGTVIIPGVIGLLLILLPFIDRSPERSPRKRPWVVGTTGVVFAGVVALTVIAIRSSPPTISVIETPGGGEVAAGVEGDVAHGKELYAEFGCGGCHKINGEGGEVGSDLSKVGANFETEYIRKKLVDPKHDNPESIMPPVQAPQADIDDLVAYMASLK